MSEVPANAVTEPSRLDPHHVRLLRLAGAASVGVAVGLIVLKTWAVLATGSVAVLSSLADSVLDLVASSITFVALRVAVEPPDREHRFGHGKSEAIAGLVQAMIVSASALFVGFRAIERLVHPASLSAPAIGVGVMLGSLALTMALVVLQSYVVRRTGSLAVTADSVHYKSDLLTGLAVLLALFVSGYGGWPLADPLLGLGIAAFILASIWQIVVRCVDILLDRELADGARERIREIATARPGVHGVRGLRTRSSGAMQFIQLYVEVDPGLSIGAAEEIRADVQRSIAADFPSAEILISLAPHYS